jgi:hypothetical protein
MHRLLLLVRSDHGEVRRTVAFRPLRSSRSGCSSSTRSWPARSWRSQSSDARRPRPARSRPTELKVGGRMGLHYTVKDSIEELRDDALLEDDAAKS